MPIRFEDRLAVFDGACTVEEATPLAEWLEGRANARVDLGRCTGLHTALLQLLMAARADMAVEPEDGFLKAWVAPQLRNPSP